jgi:protein O-GlcNAc transferase
MTADELAELDHADALAALRAACARGDRSPATVLNLAIAQDRAGFGDDARLLLRDLAELLPEWDEPPLRLANSFRRESRRQEAEAAYKAVLDINPRREEALVALAALMIERANPAGAQPLLVRCIGINPDRAEAWDLLGVALTATADVAAAETAFAEAHMRAPRDIGIALRHAEAACRAGSAEAELARRTLASDADPLNPAVYAARGLLLERLGQRSAAIDALEAATALGDCPAQVYVLLGTLLAQGRSSRTGPGDNRAGAQT